MARDGIRQLSSGNFQARYQHPVTHKSIARTFPRKAAAKDWLASQRADLLRGEWIDPRAGQITLREWSDEWLAAHKVRPRTIEGYRTDLRVHILPTLGDLTLTSITPQRIRTWYGERRATGHEAAASKAYRTLKTMMNAAVDDGRVPSNPCTIKGAGEAPTTEVRPLSLEELWQVHDRMVERYRAWVLVAGFGGLRWGEAAALTVGDIRHEAISVTKQLRWPRGGQGHVVEPPKSTAGRRSVALPSFATESLADHVRNYTDGDSESLVFTTPSGTPLRNSNFRRREWKSATADLDWKPRIHDLRHTCASLAISAGVDVKSLQQMLGHASAAMTLDRYGHLFDHSSSKVADAMSTLTRPTTA